MIRKYAWADNARTKLPPQVVGEELERLRGGRGGGLTPKSVVDAARPKDAPLHPEFEWHDGKAAEMYRQEQARNLIRSVRIAPAEKSAGENEIAFVSVETSPGHREYVPTARLLSNEDLHRQAILDAVSLLRGVQHRLTHLRELKPVTEAIDRELGKVEKRLEEKRKKKPKAA